MELLVQLLEAHNNKTWYAYFKEHPHAYGADAFEKAWTKFDQQCHKDFEGLIVEGAVNYTSLPEVSPYTQRPLGIKYPFYALEGAQLLQNAQNSTENWRNIGVKKRTTLLIEAVSSFRPHLHELAYALQHTTGKSFGMAFQAVTHAFDYALEQIIIAYKALLPYPKTVDWQKPFGATPLKLTKTYVALPKGISLVMADNFDPLRFALPALFANLVCGNVVLLKPHDSVVLPIALVVKYLQQYLQDQQISPQIVQLSLVNEKNQTQFVREPAISVIDYVGTPTFRASLKNLSNKEIFTHNSVINSAIVHSVYDLRLVMRNIAYTVSLYSGQGYGALQNIFIPETGVQLEDGTMETYDEVVALLKNELLNIALNPKTIGMLGALQNAEIAGAMQTAKSSANRVLSELAKVRNKNYPAARQKAPLLLEALPSQKALWSKKWLGGVVVVVKVKNSTEALDKIQTLAQENKSTTAMRCVLYHIEDKTTSIQYQKLSQCGLAIDHNFVGLNFPNQHFAFSDSLGQIGTNDYVKGRFSVIVNRSF
ncbi:MAG: aldehyde dehydrogenase family protein [Chitinophagales bacterium]